MVLTGNDVYLFREGTHGRLYDKLGCRLLEASGGARFAVWAPNAAAVAVIGDCNGWRSEADGLTLREDGSGIWEGIVPAAAHGQALRDGAAKARITRFESGPERAFAIADLTPAYAKNARRVWRGIALLDRDKVLVQDEIQADKPVELCWFMHTPASVKIEDNGHTANLQLAGALLRAEILSPAEAKFQIMDAQPLATSPHPERQAKN